METTCGIFIMRDGLILIGHITGATRGAGGWSIPKGLAEPGESHKAAAVRETMEETGILLNPEAVSGPIATVRYKNKNKTLVAFETSVTETETPETLVCESTFTDKDGVERPEIDDFRWVHPLDAAVLLNETVVQAMAHTSWRSELMDCKSGELEVYDFDGTLMDTLDAETGPSTYERIKGEKWKYAGWWSKPESLDCDLPFRALGAATAALRDNPCALKVVVTNRLPALEPHIASVLVQHDLDQHISHVTCSAGKLTKPQRVERLALALGATSVTVWEDRSDQVQEYLTHGSILDLPTKINIVSGDDLVGTIDVGSASAIKRYIIRTSGNTDPLSLIEISDLLAPLKIRILDDSVFPRMLLVEGEAKNLARLKDALGRNYIVSEENEFKVPTARKSAKKD